MLSPACEHRQDLEARVASRCARPPRLLALSLGIRFFLTSTDHAVSAAVIFTFPHINFHVWSPKKPKQAVIYVYIYIMFSEIPSLFLVG